MLGVRF